MKPQKSWMEKYHHLQWWVIGRLNTILWIPFPETSSPSRRHRCEWEPRSLIQGSLPPSDRMFGTQSQGKLPVTSLLPGCQLCRSPPAAVLNSDLASNKGFLFFYLATKSQLDKHPQSWHFMPALPLASLSMGKVHFLSEFFFLGGGRGVCVCVLVVPMACKSSQARAQTHIMAVAMLNP